MIALNDKIVIKPVEEEYTGEFLMPDQNKERPIVGVVVAVPESAWITFGGKLESSSVKVGDKVAIPKFGAQVLTLNVNEEYYVVSHKELLVKLESDTAEDVREKE